MPFVLMVLVENVELNTFYYWREAHTSSQYIQRVNLVFCQNLVEKENCAAQFSTVSKSAYTLQDRARPS